MTYIVINDHEIVKAEMERPEDPFGYYSLRSDDGQDHNKLWVDFEKHCLSLPRIAAPGHKWKLWSEVVEGKDFRLEKQFLNENDEWQGIHFFTSIWDDLKNEFRRIVAIPIQPTPEGEKVEEGTVSEMTEIIQKLIELQLRIEQLKASQHSSTQQR